MTDTAKSEIDFGSLSAEHKLQLAIHIHRNHDQVIAALKEDQWKYFTWSTAILGAVALGDAATASVSQAELIAVVCFISVLGVTALLRAQMGLVSRLSELAFLQKKIGSAYSELRKKSASGKANFFFRIEVWGFQTLMLVLLPTLIITR